MVGESPLNRNFLSSGMAIDFRRPLGNLGCTWLTPPPFWLHIWSIEDFYQSKVRYVVSFWFFYIDCILIYRSEYVFVLLCLDVLVAYIVSLQVRYDSCYAFSSTHRVAP